MNYEKNIERIREEQADRLENIKESVKDLFFNLKDLKISDEDLERLDYSGCIEIINEVKSNELDKESLKGVVKRIARLKKLRNYINLEISELRMGLKSYVEDLGVDEIEIGGYKLKIKPSIMKKLNQRKLEQDYKEIKEKCTDEKNFDKFYIKLVDSIEAEAE